MPPNIPKLLSKTRTVWPADAAKLELSGESLSTPAKLAGPTFWRNAVRSAACCRRNTALVWVSNVPALLGRGGVSVNPKNSEFNGLGPEGNATTSIELPGSARKFFFKFEFSL